MGQCTSGELPPAIVKDEDTDTGNENSLAESQASEMSSNKPRSRRSSAASWVSSRLQRRHKTKDLSAAFNLLDHDNKSNLVNINLASEEELMTLQGIGRQLAKSIVEYRNTIGGFRRVEDLALVSGVGAAMLQAIKTDVTIRKYPSYSSSRTQSFDSIPSCESLRSQRSAQSNSGRSLKNSPMKRVNINYASIFELMNIRGMNQEMAANIVHYRSKRGKFGHIDDLVKVRGINYRMLSVLRSFLTCDDDDGSPSSPGTFDSLSVASSGKPPVVAPAAKFSCHRRTHSAPLNSDGTTNDVIYVEPQATATYNHHSHRFSSEFSADLFELLSLRSDRPLYGNVFNGVYEGNSAVRIGSWNMQQLTLEKVSNPGVLEVICRTILETGFSLIALQDVGHTDVLKKICCELNTGSLRRIREWSGPRGEWRWQVSEEPTFTSQSYLEYAAFLYNACHGVQLITSGLLQVHSNNNSKLSCALFRKPFLGYFKVRELEIVVVNLHIQMKKHKRNKIDEEEELEETRNDNDSMTTNNKAEKSRNVIDNLCLFPLISALRERLDSEKFVILLGNFNLPPHDQAFKNLKESSHCHIIPSDVPTDISYNNPKGSECADNIWLSCHGQKFLTGSWGVVREGLSHMAIPRGWGWGGMVSDHCPIYCDLYTSMPLHPKKSALLNGK